MSLWMLQRNLNRLLEYGSKPARKKTDPDYLQFRKECKAKGITYKLSHDRHYIDFSDGEWMPHYDWAESLQRLTTGQYHQ
jgi:hypothetical protein